LIRALFPDGAGQDGADGRLDRRAVVLGNPAREVEDVLFDKRLLADSVADFLELGNIHVGFVGQADDKAACLGPAERNDNLRADPQVQFKPLGDQVIEFPVHGDLNNHFGDSRHGDDCSRGAGIGKRRTATACP